MCWTGALFLWENQVHDVCVRMLGGYVVVGMGKNELYLRVCVDPFVLTLVCLKFSL